MTDEQALLRAVLDAPEDDAPRMVMADWYDDHEQVERAEFIRVQVRLAKLGFANGCPTCRNYGGPCDTCERMDVETLQRQEQELFNDEWFDPKGHLFNQVALHIDDYVPGRVYGRPVRGFIGHVRLTCAAFTGRPCPECRLPGRYCRLCFGTTHIPGLAATLFAAHPITSVTLTDKSPDFAFWWWRDTNHQYSANRAYLPPDILDLLVESTGMIGRRFTTVQDAVESLSAACVHYGRSVAIGHTHEVSCPACSGEGCSGNSGYLDKGRRCDGSGVLVVPGLPPFTPKPAVAASPR